MGVNISKCALEKFECFNNALVAAGGGVLGILLIIYRGLNTENFKTLFVCGLSVTSILYVFSTKEIVPLTNDKVIFISGCDSGLGFSLAQHTCDLGFKVIASCLSLQSEGAKELNYKYEKRIFLVELDLTKPSNIADVVILTQSFLAANTPCEFWALINNAGVMVFGEFEWLTDRLIKEQIDVNLSGTMCLTKAFLPILRQFSGRVINISSHCANATLPGLSTYGATKAALSAWSDGLRIEQKKYGVSIINFIPGSFVAQSNIMSKQKDHVSEMRQAFTHEQKLFYGDYFKEYNNYLNALSGHRKPKKIDDDMLYEIFNHALLSKNPSSTYVHESWKYKLYHLLFRITPCNIRDNLIAYFIQMPKWNQDKKKRKFSYAIG